MPIDCFYKDYFFGIDTHVDLSVGAVEPRNAVLQLDGYKHSLVQVIALTIAAKGYVVINNPPLVTDTYVFVALINELGGSAYIQGKKLFINAQAICNYAIPCKLSNTIHGSMYLCPALLCALGEFRYFGSGGCRIGNNQSNERPVHHIMSVIDTMGGRIDQNEYGIHGKIQSRQKHIEIDILQYSTEKDILSGALVGGATKTAIIMSLCNEEVIIKHPYIKTDVLDMLKYISLLGKTVHFSEGEIIISGKLSDIAVPVEFTLTECISEIITYSILSILCNTTIRFMNLNRETISVGLAPEFSLLSKIGANVFWHENDLIVSAGDTIRGQQIEVLPNTIQSDHQPFFALLLLFSKEKSTIVEHVWESRYQYVDNLVKMGATIKRIDNSIHISPSRLFLPCCELNAHDVRCAAVTLIAMIIARSSAILVNAEHIFRGYSRLLEQLRNLGIEINIFSRGFDEGILM